VSNETENRNLSVKDENTSSIIKELDGINVNKDVQKLWTIVVFDKTEKALFEQMQAVRHAINIILERSLAADKPEGTESYINSLTKLQRTYLQQMEALYKLQEKRLNYLW